ncbi:cytochrome C biogenesis protein CcdA [Salmonella enterica subsp. enterica]|nr:cytochrome C biogenesis protein CcdA [Salmonella enterica subsp. enterica serovar Reading]MLO26017.1 cytochrome C biogenesis protein CcdA [Salmonella enterica subsp. enterica serovar Reading]
MSAGKYLVHENHKNNAVLFLGMPLHLFWGYIAIAIFMTGDGIELAFLSKYMVVSGFTPDQAAIVFTVYGLTAAISSWFSGVLAELYGAKKLMIIGTVWWLVFQSLFLSLGLGHHNYNLMLLFYGLRGFAYPLFFYAFFFLVIQETPTHRLASAVGWIWSMFTIGYGIIASFLPSYTIPRIGFIATLWLSMIFVATGGGIAIFRLRTKNYKTAVFVPSSGKIREISKGLTLIFTNKDIFLALIIRIICNLSFFGLPVVMPLYFTSDKIGFTTSEWLSIWGICFMVQPVSNVLWGNIGDKIGWMRQMRWAGFIGCGTATLLFYYLPLFYPHSFLIGTLVAIFFALTVTSFVPMGAIFPIIAPDHQGAAISVQNFGGGLSNFMGPALAAVLLSHYGIKGVIITYAGLYFLAAGITYFIKIIQPVGKSATRYQIH